MLIPLDVGNKLVIIHSRISRTEVKKIFKNRSVVMLEGLKIKERAGINGSNVLSSYRLGCEDVYAHLIIKRLSGTKQNGIEFVSIKSDRDGRFRLLILGALAETDELVFKREEVWFVLRENCMEKLEEKIGRFGTDMILRVKTELMNPIPMSGLVGDKREFIGTLLELQRLRHHGGCL